VLGAATLLLLFSTPSEDGQNIALRFTASAEGAPLQLNDHRYPNPGGEGVYSVRDLQLYISNIVLEGAGETYRVEDSYHLIRFDNASGASVVYLRGVPLQQIDRIEFGIGVDKAANASIEPRGDLDPNSRMAWSWDVGYKFFLFEGQLLLGEKSLPLVYHIGFDENYRKLEYKREESNMPRRLDFEIVVDRLFDGESVIDMSSLSNVKFDREDAATIARNFSDLIRFCGSTPCHEQ
jgi:hypothetical protein